MYMLGVYVYVRGFMYMLGVYVYVRGLCIC